MNRLLRKLDRASKMVLWLPLVRHGEFGLLGRFYAPVWTTAAAVLYCSVGMLLQSGQPMPLRIKSAAVLAVCPLVTFAAYAFARFVPVVIVSLAVLIPGTMTIAPTVKRDDTGVFASSAQDKRSVYVSTSDVPLFFKGALVCLALSSLSLLLQNAGRLPPFRDRKRRWPLRWATASVLLISGLIGLEMMRVALRIAPGIRVPWGPLLRALMFEPRWPQAIALWLWLNTAYLLARYDSKLIPYLLRRTGQPWVPDELSLQDAYLVDSLLHQLAPRPRSDRKTDR